jgi:hypothetical protein
LEMVNALQQRMLNDSHTEVYRRLCSYFFYFSYC